MTAVLTVTCDGPDCAETTTIDPDPGGGFDLPHIDWVHVHIDLPGTTTEADYCGWSCYAAHVTAMAMDGGVR